MKFTRKTIQSVGSFFFFFHLTKIANASYSETNNSGRRRTTRFSGIRFRVRALTKSFTIYPQLFSTPEISEKLSGSPTKVFGTVRQKKIGRKILIPLPSLIHKLFVDRKIPETQHRRVPLRKFSAL